MRLFAVSYDLDKPGQDWHSLIQRIRQWGGMRVQYSQWMFQADSTAVTVRDDLALYMDANDRLLVIDTTTGQMAWKNLMADPKTAFALA
jgi:CRISPR/Cas system-associated endoribonuclease Cas2